MAEKFTKYFWRDMQTGKLIKNEKNGRLILCWVCPCCNPKVLASTITSASDESTNRWNLKPYQKEKMGLPGHLWRLRDVGEAHHNNPTATCSGSQYYSGTIDGNGKLTNLPDEFVSRYYYNGYMELQMGCVRPDGSVEWPCP